MKASTIGIIILVVLASLLIVAWHFLSPLMEERRFDRTSDAGKIKEEISIAGDSWLGYFILRSPEFKKLMRDQGINPKWIDDNAQYKERMEKFAQGDYHFIVATVDSYVLNACQVNPSFPGVIIAVIDESKGGDAIVAKTTITDLNELDRPDIKIALTPDSPSEFLMKAVASHFNVQRLSMGSDWKVETDGAKGAYDALRKDRVPVAVMWEPYVSKILQSNVYHKLLGTEKTSGLIVDILIAHRDAVDNSPEIVNMVMKNYFRALQYYQKDSDSLETQAAEDTNEKKDVARKMLDGISLIDFKENCRGWFGIGQGDTEERLVSTIESTIGILRDNGDLSGDPLEGNPYTIINSNLFENLVTSGSFSVAGKFTVGPDSDAETATRHEFSNLDTPGWNNLKRVGTLRVRPIIFQSSTQILSMNGKEEVDAAAEVIQHYPHFRILIKGHTSPGGDEEANRKLSEERAMAVRQYLVSVHDVETDRVKAIGVGSSEPLNQRSNESYRAYKLRLQRVEFIFLENNK